jgi:hypothetical protein
MNFLNEVNMSPGSLKDFLQSDIVKNIKVGFEAELLVPNLKDYSDIYICCKQRYEL